MITLENALKNLINRKRRPRSCIHCFMTCLYCEKDLDKDGFISKYMYYSENRGPYTDPMKCNDCRRYPFYDLLTCPVLDVDVEPYNKPRCTAYDIKKKLLEKL